MIVISPRLWWASIPLHAFFLLSLSRKTTNASENGADILEGKDFERKVIFAMQLKQMR